MRKVLQNLYEKAWPSRWGPPLTLMTALLSFVWIQANAQTDRIPVADGNFSNGSTFTANGWSVSNGTNHQWIVGSGHGLGAPFAGNAAYVTNAAPAYAYTPANNSNNFFWRDVTVPAGENIIQLSFDWNQQGEASWDLWQVFVGPTSITPVGNNTHPGSGTTSVPTPIAGATYIGNGAPTAGIQSFTASIPASFAGTTFRLIFSWKNETGGTQPPAAIDNIRLTSAVPANRLATATGGLWSSPTTWADGVVPAPGNDITIPAGSTVYIDQATNYRNYTINGTLGWGSGTFAMTATGDVTVAAGGTFYGFNSGGAGQTINCLGSFTSNGFANLSVSALLFGGTGAATLGGGSFSNYYNNGSQALVAGLTIQNTGSLNVALPFNVRTLTPLSGTITGGANITLDNTQAQTSGSGNRGLFYAGVTTVATMGTGYTTAPVIGASGALAWAAGAIGIGSVRTTTGGQQYVSLDATAATAGNEPTHTTFGVQTTGDGKQWLHVGAVGFIGNALGSTATLTPVAGTQYFWNGTLYRCRIAGAITPAQIAAAMPLSTTLGTDVVIGGSTFRVCGTAARLAPNYNATAQNLRGVTILNAGSGYVSSPFVAVVSTGAGTGAAVSTAVVPALAGPANTLVQKNAPATITGTVNIGSTTGIGVPTVTDGGMYNTAPTVFIEPPTGTNSNLNYIQLAGASGGSGCTVAPTSIQFTGGTDNGGTRTFAFVVRGGSIVSLTFTGTARFSSPPTGISMTGGTFGVAPVFPNAAALAAVIPQVTATLDAAGSIVGFSVISAGSNFISAPTIALSNAGAGEVAATTTPTVRVSLYSLTASFFAATAINGVTPTTVNGAHNEATNMAGLVPSSRIIHALSSGTSQGITFTGNVILNAASPLTLGGGPIDLGGNTMVWRSLTFTGLNPSATSWIANGTIESFFNGTGFRTFPFRSQGFTTSSLFSGVTTIASTAVSFSSTSPAIGSRWAVTGTNIPAGTYLTIVSATTGTLSQAATASGTSITFSLSTPGAVHFFAGAGTSPAGGDNIGRVRVTELGAPSDGTLTMRGNRAFRLNVVTGTVFGTAPLVALGWDPNDNITSDHASLLLAQSNTGLTSGWTIRSVSSGTGALPAVGNRNTATAGVGPIVFASNMWFGWSSSFVAPPGLAYSVARTTGHVYQSIAPTGDGGDGTGTLSTAAGDEGTQLIAWPGTPFQYQGSAVTGFTIHANGYVVLNNASYTYTSASSWDNTLASFNGGTGTPDINKRNVIAPFYDDHNKVTPVIYYKIVGNVATIEWFNTTHFGLSGPQMYFQVVLDGNDESITFNYGDMQLYNGTQNIRYAYTCGISSGFISGTPQPGEIMQQQYENTTIFTNENSTRSNYGANGLAISPEPRSRIKFTPGVYVASPAPGTTPPGNDNPGAATLIPALAAFPSNIAWNNTFPSAPGSSNLFTTRYATPSPQPFCDASTGKRDVWFRFVASDPNTQVRIYPSGGFIARMEVKDQFLGDLAPSQCIVSAAQGGVITATLAGLTVGDDYYVRVYHDRTGTTALATANMSGGGVTSINVTTPGTNYPIVAQSFGYNPANTGPIVRLTGGGGNGAVAAVNNPTTTQILASLVGGNILVSNVGNGYSSAPTVTIDSPDWGITGEFGIIVFAKPTNDDCFVAADNQAALLVDAGAGNPIASQTLTGGATTNGSTTVTVTSTASLAGATQWVLTGPNLPPNVVATIVNATTLSLSAAATGTSTGLTFTARVNTVSGVTTGAATASAETHGCTGTPDDDLWYRFVATSTRHTVFMTGKGGFDPAFSVFSGAACGVKLYVDPATGAAGSCAQATANLTGANGAEVLNITTTIGQTYYIRAFHAGTGTALGGTFNLSVYTPLPLQYQHSQSSAAYTPISGGTVLASGTIDNAVYKAGLGLATPLKFNTFDYDSFYVSSNGWIQVGKVVPSTTTFYPLSVTGGFGVIAPLAADLEDAAGAGEIRYQFTGGEHVVQWSNMRRQDTVGESFSFQARMNATTGAITYHYGPGTYKNGPVVVVGLRTDQVANPTVTTAGAVPTTRPSEIFVMNRATLGSPTSQTFNQTTTGFSPTSAMALSPTSFPAAGLRFQYTASSCTPYTASDALILSFDRSVANTIRWRRVPGSQGYELRWRYSTDPVSASNIVAVGAVDTDTSFTYAPLSLNPSSYVIWDVATLCGALPTEKSHYSPPAVFSVIGDPIAYDYSHSVGTYTPITGTVVASGTTDDAMFVVNIAPLTIRINDQDFSDVSLSSNGFLVGGSVTLPTANYVPLAGLQGLGLVSPLGDDLQGNTGGQIEWADAGAEIVFEWQNWRRFAATGESFNFQARYTKATHVWRFVYSGMGTISASDSFHVGIRASTNQTRRDIVALTGGPDWTKPVMGNSAVAATFVKKFPTSAANAPVDGRTITFTPITVGGVPRAFSPVTGGTPAGVITKTDVTDLKWIRAVNPGANNGALNGYSIRYRPTTAAETFANWATPTNVGTGQTDTSMNLTGLEPGTEYLYQVAGRTTPNRTVFGGVGRFTTIAADNDLEFKSVPGPNASACFSNSVPVVIRVVNRGLNPVAIGQSIGYNVTVTPGTNHTGSFVTTAPIAPNDSLDITVGNDDFSTVTTYTISGSITWVQDEKASNNTLTPSANVTSYAIASAPVNYLMESAATGSSLSYISGTGNFTTNFGYTASMTNPTLSAQQGTNMLRFNAFSLSNGTTGRFATPCFNVPTNCFEMLFFHSRDNGFSGLTYIDEGTRVRVSTDGGITWSVPQTLRNVTTNRDTGYVRRFFAPATTPTWQEFALDLGAYNGQNIKVAFDMLSRFGNNFAIDNIRVQGKAIVNDVAMEALVAPEPLSSCGTANVSVIVRVSNKGCVSHSNIPVTVNVTGAGVSTISDVIPGPLDGGQFVNFTVGTVNMVNAGTYVFNGNALVGGDQVPANSNLPTTNVALIAPPVVNINLSNANVVIGNNITLNGTAAVASPSIAASNNTNFPIPDGPGSCGTPGTNVNSTITLVAPGVLASAIERVTVNITHNFTDDVRLTLIAPNGSSIVLINGCVVTGSNFTGTNFVASGAPSVVTGTGPLNGNWLPENPFSALTGTANGVWTLRVNDVFSIGTGTLLNWSIQIPNALNSASWTCPSCPTGFPVNFNTPPVVSVAYPNNPLGASYPAGSYDVTLTATDRQGCVNSRDTTINFFSENRWLGVNDGANNWGDPANWLATPKPPTTTQQVLISGPSSYTYPPKINSGVPVGSVQMENGSEIQISAGGSLNVAANWSSSFCNTNGAGAVVFNGSGAQTITGNHTFSNLTVNKTTGAMNINGVANVTGTVTLSNATSDLTIGSSGSLVLKSGPSGTGRIGVVPSGATITGNVTQERYIPWPGPSVNGQWFFLGSPIVGKDFRDFADDFVTYGPASAYGSQGAPIQILGPQHSTILAYNPALANDSTDEAQKNGWRAPSGNVTNGQGYRVYIKRASNVTGTFDNVGTVKTGPATFPQLTRSTFTSCTPASFLCNTSLTGWNLVSNPYPSAIDFSLGSPHWNKPANMQDAAYRYFGGGAGGFGMAGYGAYITGLGWSGASPAPANPEIIPSSQGFFVRLVSGTTGVLTVNESAKTTGAGTFTRTNVVLSNVLRIRLEKPVMNGDYFYNGVVRFMSEATNEFDPLYDYGNMGGSGFFFSFPVSGDQLMVNSLASLTEQITVPMNTYFRGSAGTYQFNFSELGSFPAGVEIFLRDNFTNMVTSIMTNPSVTFEVNSSNMGMTDRFELIFNPSAVTGIRSVIDGVFFGIRPNPAAGNGKVTFAVSGVEDESAAITVVDMVGKVVFRSSMKLTSELLNEQTVDLGLPSGVYTVNFASRTKSFKEKLIVR